MSNLAKIFVVLILVLSVAYVGISMALFSQQVGSADEVELLREKLQQSTAKDKQEIDIRQQKIDFLSAEVTQKDKKIATLTNRSAELSSQLKEATAGFGQLEGVVEAAKIKSQRIEEQYDALDAKYKDVVSKVASREQEVVDLKGRLVGVSRQVSELDAQLRLSQKRADALATENELLRGRVHKVEGEVNSYRSVYGLLPESIISDRVTAAPVRAKVLLVSETPKDLIVLNVGRRSGVKPGSSFVVYRDKQLVGKVVAEKVDDDITAARIDSEYSATGIDIQIGDQATTSLLY